MGKIRTLMQIRHQNVKIEFGTLFDISLIMMRVRTAQVPNEVLTLKYDLEQKKGEVRNPFFTPFKSGYYDKE